MNEAEVRRVLSVKIFVMCIIAAVITIFLLPYTMVASPYPSKGHWPMSLYFFHWGQPQGFPHRDFFFAAVALYLYPVLINSLLPKRYRLSAGEIALVGISLLPIVYPLTCGEEPFLLSIITYTYSGLTSPTTEEWVIKYAPPFFGPKDMEVLMPMSEGGAPVPWGAWILPITWYSIFILSFFGFLIFYACLVRRLWIEEEYLPFPSATIMSVCTKGLLGEGGTSFYKSSYFWAGFAIAWLLIIPQVWDAFAPFTPVLIGADFTPLALTTAVINFPLHPVGIGFGMFVPESFLVTLIVAYILLYVVLPPLLWVPIGWLAPLPPGRGAWFVFNRWIGKFEFTPGTPLTGGYMTFCWGMIWGLALFPLIVHRRYFIEVFRRAFKAAESSSEEPLSYKNTILGMVACAIIYIIACVIVNVPIHLAILELILVGLWHIGLTRWHAETGWGAGLIGGWTEWNSIHFQSLLPALDLTTSPAVATPFMATTFIWTNTCWGGGSGSIHNIGGLLLDAFRIARDYRISTKHVLLVYGISTVLTVILGSVIMLWLVYTYSISGLPIANNLIWYFSYRPCTEGLLHNPIWSPTPGYWANLAFGFIFIYLVYYLRRRFGGIFNYIAPAAILVTCAHGVNLWLPFIIAFIIRRLLLRIGGAPLLERIGTPLGAGLIVGSAVWMPVGLCLNWLAYSMGWIGG